jgi:peptide/nickel transport system substrate-binding protein
MIGVGYGFDSPTPYRGTGTYFYFDKIYSTDKYTLVFEFSKPTFDIQDTIANMYGTAHPKEVIEVYGDRAFEDWKNQVGTGPFILKDYVAGSSGTLIKNDNYWDYDERFPENRLPYIDNVKILIIPDSSTAYAALRTGKIETLPNVNWEIGKQLLSSNPHLKYIAAKSSAYGLRPRVDVEPFDDINVRKALNMAIDRETIAATFYGGNVDGIPVAMTSQDLGGYYESYTEWPQDVQDGYMYDPEGAKALLAEAGYPNGFKTSVTIGSTSDLDLCQIFQAYLAEVGIEMDIDVVESTVFSDYVNRNRKHEYMAWDYFAWTFSPMRPFTIFYSENVRDNQNIVDPVYDEMYLKEVWEEGEPLISSEEYQQRLMDKVHALNQHIVSHYWIVPGPPSFTYIFWQPWLKGYSGENGRCALNYSRCWIDEDLKKEILGQ